MPELTGNAAKRFAQAHLEKIATNLAEWTTTYRDPGDGSLWVMDHPQAELNGGGPPRLRRLGHPPADAE